MFNGIRAAHTRVTDMNEFATFDHLPTLSLPSLTSIITILEMWANAQPDGRPAGYRWRPLFNAAKFG